jgi:hypothetical protein
VTSGVLILAVVASTLIGLLWGMLVWRFYIAFTNHRPQCPHKDDVIAESKRVVLDITQLTQGGRT